MPLPRRRRDNALLRTTNGPRRYSNVDDDARNRSKEHRRWDRLLVVNISNQFRLDNCVSVVTGGGQGIGRAIAWALADIGSDVVINARRIADLEVTAAGIQERGRRALIVAGDIRDFSEVVADRTMAEFGRIDVWVNNVGGSDDKTTRALVDTPDDVFRSQLELNLTSAFQGCKAAAKRMTNGGSIINISSGAGTRGSPFTGPYAAAKAGMNNLTQTLALELAPSIRVNAVAPGPVVTEAFIDVLNVESELDDIAATIPLARLGTPQDIAAAVVYFATPASSWITGQLLLVAGGRTQRTHTYKPK